MIQVGASVNADVAPASLLCSSPMNLRTRAVCEHLERFAFDVMVIVSYLLPVVGKLTRQIVHEQFLHLLVGLGQQIDVARFGDNRFALVVATADYLKLQAPTTKLTCISYIQLVVQIDYLSYLYSLNLV